MRLTVRSSTFSAALIVPKYAICSELLAGLMTRETDATTASALKASPLWNLTPSRNLNCQVVASICLRRLRGQTRHEFAGRRPCHQRLIDVVVDLALAAVIPKLRIERRRLRPDGDGDGLCHAGEQASVGRE